MNEEAGFHLFRCGRRPPRGRQRVAPGDGAAEAAVRDPHGQPAGSAGCHGCLPQGDRTSPAGPLQPDAEEGMDARFAAVDDGHALGDPAVSPQTVRLLEEFWREDPPGYGGFAGAQFRPRAVREPGARAARRSVGHHSDGYRRLPAALLDRASRSSISSAAPPRPWSRRAPWGTPQTRCIAFPA